MAARNHEALLKAKAKMQVEIASLRAGMRKGQESLTEYLDEFLSKPHDSDSSRAKDFLTSPQYLKLQQCVNQAKDSLDAKMADLQEIDSKIVLTAPVPQDLCTEHLKQLENTLKPLVANEKFKYLNFNMDSRSGDTRQIYDMSIYLVKVPFTIVTDTKGNSKTVVHEVAPLVKISTWGRGDFSTHSFPHIHLLEEITKYIQKCKDPAKQSAATKVLAAFGKHLSFCSSSLKIEQQKYQKNDDSGYGGTIEEKTSFTVGDSLLVVMKDETIMR